MIKDIRIHSIMGTIAMIVYCMLNSSELILQNVFYEKLALYCETLVFVAVMLIFAHTTGVLSKLQKKQKASTIFTKLETLPKVVQMIIGAVVAFPGAALMKLFLSSVMGL